MILITGGAGFLGNAILQRLKDRKEKIRALVLPSDPLVKLIPEGVEVCEGDLNSETDMDRFFLQETDDPLTVIHCASLITMSMTLVEKTYQVNVKGAERIIEHCLKTRARLIYVSSVHAIPELPKGQVMTEPTEMDPENAVGYYAKTKAQATGLVMRARREQGLNANIVYPSGISGPGAYKASNMTQMMLEYDAGRIPMGVEGGYNFVDVRDVAGAIVDLLDRDLPGEDFILAGEYISVMEMFALFSRETGRKRIRSICPLWLVKMAMPFLTLYYRLKRVKPVFSTYSLQVLSANCLFSDEKARKMLGYQPRPIKETLSDTLHWLVSEGMIKTSPTKKG